MKATEEQRKSNAAFFVGELFPRSKDKREDVIIGKFIGALKHFEDRTLVKLGRGDNWPDIECKEDNTKVGVEIVQIKNAEHVAHRCRQGEYIIAIREMISDIYPQLSGLWIVLNDGYQNPPYPKLTRKIGRSLVHAFSENLRSNVKQFEDLPVGNFFNYVWQTGSETPTIGAYGYRYSPKELNNEAFLRFSGVFPERTEVLRGLLSKAIELKIKKKYTKYRNKKLWLLVYESDFITVGEPPSDAAAVAHQILQEREHPFDEVWYLFPIAQEKLGFIEKVWP